VVMIILLADQRSVLYFTDFSRMGENDGFFKKKNLFREGLHKLNVRLRL
jgi:hypothetical protein